MSISEGWSFRLLKQDAANAVLGLHVYIECYTQDAVVLDDLVKAGIINVWFNF